MVAKRAFRFTLLGIFALLLAAPASLWAFRAPLIEAAAERALSRSGAVAEITLGEVGLSEAVIERARLTRGEVRLAEIEQARLTYRLSDLFSRRVETITIARADIRVETEPALRVAGFELGAGGGGGAPPVNTARIETLTVRLDGGEDAQADIKGSVSLAANGEFDAQIDQAIGRLRYQGARAGLETAGGRLSRDAQGRLEGAISLTLAGLSSPFVAADRLDLSLEAAPFAPAMEADALAGVLDVTARLTGGSLSVDPGAPPLPAALSGSDGAGPVGGAGREDLTARLAAFDAELEGSIALSADGQDRLMADWRIMGQGAGDLSGEIAVQAPVSSQWRETDWRASGTVRQTGRAPLDLCIDGAEGQGAAVSRLTGMADLDVANGATRLVAEALAFDYQVRPGGWRADLDGGLGFSGQLAGHAIDGARLSGPIALTGEAGALIVSAPAEESGRRVSARAVSRDAWRVNDLALDWPRGAARLTLSNGAIVLTGPPALTARIARAEIGETELAGLTLEGVQPVPDTDLFAAAETLSVNATARNLRLARLRLPGGLTMESLTMAGPRLTGALAPDLAAIVTSQAVSMDWTGGDAAVSLGAARLSAELSGALDAARARVQSGGVSVNSPPWPVTMDQAGLSARVDLSAGLTVEGEAGSARITLKDEAVLDAPVFASGEFSLQDGRLVASGRANPEASAEGLAAFDLTHDLTDGAGEIAIRMDETRYAPRGRQPQDVLVPLRGLVANVDGAFAGQAQLAWGGDALTSSGWVEVRDADFATRFGPVEGVQTRFALSSLTPLLSDGEQTVTIERFNPGVVLSDGSLGVSLLPEGRVGMNGEWPFASGRLIIPDLVWTPSEDSHRVALQAEELNLAELVGLVGNEAVTAGGRVSGVLPAVIEAGSIRIEDGRLSSDGEGYFSYRGRAGDAAAQSGEQASLAFRALEDFRYDALSARVNGELTGELDIAISLEGYNPDVLEGYPFAFDVSLSADVLNLIRDTTRGLRLGDEIEAVIREGLN